MYCRALVPSFIIEQKILCLVLVLHMNEILPCLFVSARKSGSYIFSQYDRSVRQILSLTTSMYNKIFTHNNTQYSQYTYYIRNFQSDSVSTKCIVHRYIMIGFLKPMVVGIANRSFEIH